MKNKLLKCVLVLSTAMILFTGCGEAKDNQEAKSNNSAELEKTMDDEDIEQGLTDFSINLFKENLSKDANTVISPISVVYALDMLTAGSEGETQEELLNALCKGADSGDLVIYASEYMDKLDGKSKFKLANSIWINNGDAAANANEEYVSSMEKYMKAQVTTLEFNDDAKDEINKWVDDSTDGMIKEIIDNIPANAGMYLINAMAFDGEWTTPYEDYQIDEDGIFHNSKGQDEEVTLLHGLEKSFIESDAATGFIKDYKGGKYAFVAILPKDENISIESFMENMTGEDFIELIESETGKYDVYTSIPKFKQEYSVNLNDALKSLGINRAFDLSDAEFKTMASTELYVENVLHKVFIELDEKGTKAAAATSVQMSVKSMPDPSQEREVKLERPFVYAIIDKESNLPVIIGAFNSVK